jgi:predicted RNA binding protein YcfA (HicA-like mRNA interferase family)
MNRNPKVREVRIRLIQLGCKRVRCNGSHETWEAPDRSRCVIKINHLGNDISARVLSCVRRWLRCARLDLDGDQKK